MGWIRDQTGAVTADWVVLTGLAAAFALLLIAALSGGTVDLAGEISGTLADAGVQTLGPPGAAMASRPGVIPP